MIFMSRVMSCRQDASRISLKAEGTGDALEIDPWLPSRAVSPIV